MDVRLRSGRTDLVQSDGVLITDQSEIFLPKGYPDSVSSDYAIYQFWDSAQALCSSGRHQFIITILRSLLFVRSSSDMIANAHDHIFILSLLCVRSSECIVNITGSILIMVVIFGRSWIEDRAFDFYRIHAI